MRLMDAEILKAAQVFTARWGFLTKDLFFKFFCQKQRTQKFEYWNWLVESGQFVKSKSNPEILFLSKKGRGLLKSDSRPSRFHIFIDHDAIIADFLMTLQRYDLVREYWLEDELMRDPALAYRVLGADKVYRIPDLIFDLKTPTGQVRCVLEIEKTMKTNARYSKMALAYSDYSHINLVLFGCDGSYTENAIGRAFGESFGAGQRVVPGIFLYEDFLKSAISTTVRFAEKEFIIAQVFEHLSKQPLIELSTKEILNRTAVRFRISDFKEAG